MAARLGLSGHDKIHYRLYRLEGLSLRRKRPRRHVTAERRQEREAAVRPNQQWSMHFVSDRRRIRALTLVDNYTREALTIVVDGGIRGEQVVRAVEQVAAWRGAPQLIRVDNGPSSCRRCWIAGPTSAA
jgi:putative transposase